MIPRYSVGARNHKGYPVLRITDITVVRGTYRTMIAAQDVADKLNQWAGQES